MIPVRIQTMIVGVKPRSKHSLSLCIGAKVGNSILLIAMRLTTFVLMKQVQFEMIQDTVWSRTSVGK